MTAQLLRWLLAAWLAALPWSASAQSGDAFRIGGVVQVQEPVGGDLTAFGGNVLLQAPVAGKAQVAAGKVALMSAVNGELSAAGGDVSIQGPVGGNLQVAGGRVAIGPEATIGGSARIAAGDVTVNGPLRGPATIYAGHVVIDSEVSGSLTVRADVLELRAGARLRGPLNYSGRQALIRHPDAEVASISEQRLPDGGAWRPWAWFKAVLVPILQIIGLAILVLAAPLWLAMFPGWAERSQARLTASPLMSVLAGVLAILGVLLGALILLVTIVGSPIALLLILLLPLMLLAGFFTAAGALGDELIRLVVKGTKGPSPGFGRRAAALALGIVLLALLLVVPYWGWPLLLLVVTAGTGALVMPASKRVPPATPSSAVPA